MDNLNKKVMDKENNFYARLNKLNDNIKKIDNYIKNNKEVDIEGLDHFNKELGDLTSEYDILREIIYETEDELNKLENKPNKQKMILIK